MFRPTRLGFTQALTEMTDVTMKLLSTAWEKWRSEGKLPDDKEKANIISIFMEGQAMQRRASRE